jgi:glycosyltransferase involved in cell wall biosynthesis
MPRSLDIIVPVFNEADSIDEFHDRMARLGLSSHLLFVDNASTDGTIERIERHGSRLLRHARNQGYGASIRHGIAATDGERIVIIDADLEYPPEAVPALAEALDREPVVYASRFLGPRPPDMPLLRRGGNRLVSFLFNLLYRQHTTDFYTGMKGLRRSALPLGDLRRDGFEHGVELGALITLAGRRIHDIPVDYHPRRSGRSKMRHIPETVKLLAHLVRYWLRCVVCRRPLSS